MSWVPSAEGLQQLIGIFKKSSSGSTEVQLEIQKQLEGFVQGVPDYGCYLAHILSALTSETPDIRQIAGLQLKNLVKYHWDKFSANPAFAAHIQGLLLRALGDAQRQVRTASASICNELVVASGIDGSLKVQNPTTGALQDFWPFLVSLLDTPDSNLLDGAMNALTKICEDNADHLAEVDSQPMPMPQKPIQGILLPKLIPLITHPNEYIRRDVLSCIVNLINFGIDSVRPFMDHLLQALFNLITADSRKAPGTRSTVEMNNAIRVIVTIAQEAIEYLMPNIGPIVEFMLVMTQCKDDLTALNACEFWSTLADCENCAQILGGGDNPVLPRLVPVLLNGMVFSEDEQADMMAEDQSKKINPALFKIKSGIRSFGAEGSSAAPKPADDDEEGYDEEDDEDEFEDDYSRQWTLRKCSAAGLDVLSEVFGDSLLPVLLPLVQERMQPTIPWSIRESAILALGAVAHGCYQGMQQYLAGLVPFLLSNLADKMFPVRSITCWTVSRFSRWIAVTNPTHRFLEPTLKGLLERVLDGSRKVQEAACSAVAVLEEEATDELVPYLTPMLQTFGQAFQAYAGKNLLILYDAVGTLADSVGEQLSKPDLVPLLMQPLIQKWGEIPDGDNALFPLLECLTSIAQALGAGFGQFSPPVFSRCIALVEQTLKGQEVTEITGQDPPEKEFIVCSFDLISGIAEGLGANVASLISGSNLIPLLIQCMQDANSDVRQSAFALIGDLAKSAPALLLPHAATVIPILVNNVNADFVTAVCNNATWALGEIAIKAGGPPMSGVVVPILQKLVPLIQNEKLSKSLLENTAITIGRLCMVCPDVCAPHIGNFSKNWYVALRSIKNDVEKHDAFKGMCAAIRANPAGVSETIAYAIDAIASWKDEAGAELKAEFLALLSAFKGHLGAEWPRFASQFPEATQNVLRAVYGL